jgi:long-chain acyl-CoA synthetase
MTDSVYASLPRRIDIPEKPATALLSDSAARFPERPAIDFFGVGMTYAQLDAAVDKAVGAIRSLGAERGEPIAMMTPNSPQSVILYHAILRAGCVVVQTNPLYVEREIEGQFVDAGVRFAFVSDLFHARVAAVRDKTPLEKVVVTRLDDYMPWLTGKLFRLKMRLQRRLSSIRYDEGTLAWSDVMGAAPVGAGAADVSVDDTAVYLYTSGTTGTAKAVVLSHGNVYANAYQCRAWFMDAEEGKEVFILALPQFHAFGMTAGMNLGLLLGAKLVVTPKFDAGQAMKLIERHKATLFPGVPAMYIAIIGHQDAARRDMSSIKYCISGAATLTAETKQRFEFLTGGTLVEGYGLSEASPVTHCNPLQAPNRIGAIGMPLPNTESKILLESTEEAPPGHVGELVVRGPQVMQGYKDRPEETARALKNGWLFTGDMGYADDDGFVYLMDRKKEMIITGGCNVYPKEVEEALYRIDGVVEAAVVGLPDDYLGERVAAAVVVAPKTTLTAKGIIRALKSDLAGYKVPKKIFFIDALPKSVIGKTLKRVLRERLIKTG